MGDRAGTRDGGLSRRDLITRGAIAGGLVWAAPVIRTTAAYATTANGTERPCINFYMVVINPDGQVRAAPANVHAAEVPPAIRTWFDENPAVSVQSPSVRPQPTSASTEAAAVLLPAVTGPNAGGRQCRMVLGWARKGKSFKEGYVDPNPPIAVVVGRRLIFPCPRPSSGSDTLQAPAADSTVATDSSSTTTSSTTSTTTTTTTTPPDTAPSADPSAAVGPPATSESPASTATPDAAAFRADSTAPAPTSSTPTDTTSNNGTCFDAIYLIYCCPR